ncbi:MAG: DUF4136 domain-containing protein [Acidobacteriota bacterium]
MRRAIIALVFLLFAYPVFGQKVDVKYDKTVDFSKYKTYTWAEGVRAKNPIVDQQITQLIEQQLAARGLTKTAADGDIQLLYVAAIDLDLQMTGLTWSNASNPMGSFATIGPPMDVRRGMLVVDMMDKKTDRYIWRATAKETLTHTPSGDMAKDAQRVEKLVKKAVEKMFNKYPVGK